MLAERANLHRTYISDVERGTRNVTLEIIDRLAKALDVSISTFFPESKLLNEGKFAVKTNGHSHKLVEVLLVENNPDDVEMTLQAFGKAHFSNHVQVVTDGAEALDYVFCRGKYSRRNAKNNPQVILLDLNLPKVEGLEVLGRIKADERTRSIPVVILTASQDQFKIAECLQLGAANYIAKPVNFLRLCQVTPQLNFQWALLDAPESRIQTMQQNIG